MSSNDLEILINCAAYTDVNGAEGNPSLAFEINEQGIRNLASAAKKCGVPIIHLSTDYIFDGRKESAYIESDPPNPINVYGASKLAGERALLKIYPESLILRVSWVFSRWGNNFVKNIVGKCKQGEELDLIADNQGGPSGASAIADSILQIAKKFGMRKHSIYHFRTSPLVSTFDFGASIVSVCKNLGLSAGEVKMMAISSDEFPSKVDRPQRSGLDSNRLSQEFSIEASHWQIELATTIEKLGETIR